MAAPAECTLSCTTHTLEECNNVPKYSLLVKTLIFGVCFLGFIEKKNRINWSTGQDTRLLNRKAVVQTQCSANAFELKDLNK